MRAGSNTVDIRVESIPCYAQSVTPCGFNRVIRVNRVERARVRINISERSKN